MKRINKKLTTRTRKNKVQTQYSVEWKNKRGAWIAFFDCWVPNYDEKNKVMTDELAVEVVTKRLDHLKRYGRNAWWGRKPKTSTKNIRIVRTEEQNVHHELSRTVVATTRRKV